MSHTLEFERTPAGAATPADRWEVTGTTEADAEAIMLQRYRDAYQSYAVDFKTLGDAIEYDNDVTASTTTHRSISFTMPNLW